MKTQAASSNVHSSRRWTVARRSTFLPQRGDVAAAVFLRAVVDERRSDSTCLKPRTHGRADITDCCGLVSSCELFLACFDCSAPCCLLSTHLCRFLISRSRCDNDEDRGDEHKRLHTRTGESSDLSAYAYAGEGSNGKPLFRSIPTPSREILIFRTTSRRWRARIVEAERTVEVNSRPSSSSLPHGLRYVHALLNVRLMELHLMYIHPVFYVYLASPQTSLGPTILPSLLCAHPTSSGPQRRSSRRIAVRWQGSALRKPLQTFFTRAKRI
ncbi:hypothetical protein C8R45DRAFT_1102660 [Mycena sanguinolenta]|nr:hypothetical protein C8R45DRAFT_1102660 [Mycena sanguinolenta]